MRNEKENEKLNNLKLSDKKIGLSIMSVSKEKVPLKSWSEYQEHENSLKNWYEDFMDGGYIGIITGKVSGYLEALDFDLKNDPQKTIYQERMVRPGHRKSLKS